MKVGWCKGISVFFKPIGVSAVGFFVSGLWFSVHENQFGQVPIIEDPIGGVLTQCSLVLYTGRTVIGARIGVGTALKTAGFSKNIRKILTSVLCPHSL